MPRPLAALTALAASALTGAPALADSDRALGGIAGLALVLPSDAKVKGYGEGIVADLELVYWQGRWFSPRAYAGFVLATAHPTSCAVGVSPCDLSASLFFLGGKFRLMAPIPYVGPFLELGLGVSAGQISGRIGQALDRAGSGGLYHVPFALGLALGAEHRFQLSLQYLFHPSQSLVTGALAIGFDFSI